MAGGIAIDFWLHKDKEKRMDTMRFDCDKIHHCKLCTLYLLSLVFNIEASGSDDAANAKNDNGSPNCCWDVNDVLMESKRNIIDNFYTNF